MNIKDFKESLEYLTTAELTPFIWGHAGIGKSSIVKQFAEQKGYHFFPFYLGTQSDLGDILGLADFIRDENGTVIATTFATPEWLHKTIKYCEQNPNSGAVIFLDEFNRARRDILSGIFSLALDKTFHTLKLPKNCHIIAAGNPPTDEYYVTDVNETALMARFVHIKLEPSVSEWVSYAKDKKISQNLIGFIQDQPQLLEQTHTDFELPVKVDRRSYERLNRLMALNTPQHLLEQLMQGIIGLERTLAYSQFLKESDKPLTALEVLAKEKTKLVEMWSNHENVQASFLNITCDNLCAHFVTMNTEKKQLTKDEAINVVWFLTTIPKDISFKFIKQLLTVNQTFMAAFTKNEHEIVLQDIVRVARGKNGNN